MKHTGLLNRLRRILDPKPVAPDALTGLMTRQDLLQRHERLPPAHETTQPAGAVIARWGGDEFVVLISSGQETDGLELAARTLATVPEPRPGMPTFAVGVATTRGGEPFERALALADSRMYQDKEGQRQPGTSPNHPGATVTLAEFSAHLEWLEEPTEIISVGLAMPRDHLGYDLAV